MDHRKTRTNFRRLALAFGLVLMTAGFAVGLREDEFECEQAAAKLQECCSGFVVTALECTYSTGCGTTSYPALSLDEARCITESTCAELVSRKVCERAAKAGPLVIDEDGGAPNDPEVCP